MKSNRTGASVEKAPGLAPVVSVQMPLPLLDVLADMKTSFFGLCLTAGQQVFQAMMEQDREQVCGPKHMPNPDRRAIRGGSVPSEVVLGGRRIALPRLRARSMDGKGAEAAELRLRQRPGPTRRLHARVDCGRRGDAQISSPLDPLPAGASERAISKSAVSRRFVALTSHKLTTWLAAPLAGLDIRLLSIDGLHFRDHVILLVLGLDSQGVKHVLGLREGTTENATVCKSLLADLRQEIPGRACKALVIAATQC